eukprot:jgi/Tetstr1/466479/TSEL_010986.t1
MAAGRLVAALSLSLLALLCFAAGAMPDGQAGGRGPQLMVGTQPTDPKQMPAGVNRYMIHVKEGQKQMELVQAALKQRMGPSYTERDAMKLIPLIVVDMDRHDLEELLSSDAFEDVRELMSSAVIEPDGVVSIPELPQQDVQGLTHKVPHAVPKGRAQ